MEGDVSEYVLHAGLVSSLAKPDATNMADVAHFMCELATDPNTWGECEGALPVIINAAASGAPPVGAVYWRESRLE